MINERMRELGRSRSVIRELFEYGKKRKALVGEENVFDFSLGNPSVPSPEIVNESLTKIIENEAPTALHAYTSAEGDIEVRRAIADYINKTFDESVTAASIYMTVGAAAALAATLTALTTPGDEVIVPAPYFPEYKVFIERAGAKIIPVKTSDDFSLDVEAIRAAITERTAAVIINSPNNPTGVVYTEENLMALTDMLRKESQGREPIYLIADEPYRELVYGDTTVPYLTKYYDDTVVCYSYSKSLSIPGERIGYALVCPRIKDFESVYQAIAGAGRALGYVCAPSLLQRLLPYCLGKYADLRIYDSNRRRLTEALTEYGYSVAPSRGAFYLFVKSPSGDGSEFSERAKRFELLIVPSESFGCEGYARIAYCTPTEKIEKSLPAFKALIDSYKEEK